MLTSHKLTAARIAQIVRTAKAGKYSDGNRLYLRLTPKGSVHWVFRYRFAGRERAMGLGSLASVRVATARKAAQRARDTLAHGQDPLAERHKPAIMTFAATAAEYFDKHKATLSAKDRERWNTIALYANPVIGAMPVNEITVEDVLRVLTKDDLWHRKAETASRLRGRIERVMEYAIHIKKMHSGPNPARWKGGALALALAPLSKIHKVTHFAAMNFEQVPAFMAALKQRSDVAAFALQFLIHTACRSGDILGQKGDDEKPPLMWSHISIEERVWRVPNNKSGKVHIVPLNNHTVALLQKMQAYGLDQTMVFPSTLKPGQPLARDAMRQLLNAMGHKLTVHGFRSAFRVWASKRTTVRREVIECAMAHKVTTDQVEAAYLRDDFFAERKSLMVAWSEFLSDAGEGAKVIAIR